MGYPAIPGDRFDSTRHRRLVETGGQLAEINSLFLIIFLEALPFVVCGGVGLACKG
jgi:hypothetical protein